MVADIHDRYDGKGDASIIELFARTWRAVPHVAWATICAGFLVGLVVLAGILVASLFASVTVAFVIGVLLAIAAGLFLGARWSLIVPVIVIERQNRPGAFARSGELVFPHRRTVVGVLLVSVVVAGGIDSGLGALVAYGLHGWVETWLTDVLDGVIFSSALVAVSTSLYYGLLEARPPSGREGHRTRPRQLQPWAEDVSRLAR